MSLVEIPSFCWVNDCLWRWCWVALSRPLEETLELLLLESLNCWWLFKGFICFWFLLKLAFICLLALHELIFAFPYGYLLCLDHYFVLTCINVCMFWNQPFPSSWYNIIFLSNIGSLNMMEERVPHNLWIFNNSLGQSNIMSHTHSHDGVGGHSHDSFSVADHGHSHEILDGPGSYLGREMPIVEGRDWSDRAFTVGIGGCVTSC